MEDGIVVFKAISPSPRSYTIVYYTIDSVRNLGREEKRTVTGASPPRCLSFLSERMSACEC